MLLCLSGRPMFCNSSNCNFRETIITPKIGLFHGIYLFYQQKQPPEVFYKKAVLKSFTTFTEKHMCWSLFLIICRQKSCKFIKKRLQHRCFPDNIEKFLRTPFLQSTSGHLLLYSRNPESYAAFRLSGPPMLGELNWYSKRGFTKPSFFSVKWKSFTDHDVHIIDFYRRVIL